MTTPFAAQPQPQVLLRFSLLSPLCLAREAEARVEQALAQGLGLLPTGLRGAFTTVLMQAHERSRAEGDPPPPHLPHHRDWLFQPLLPQPGTRLVRREARNFAWADTTRATMAKPLPDTLCLVGGGPGPDLLSTLAWKPPAPPSRPARPSPGAASPSASGWKAPAQAPVVPPHEAVAAVAALADAAHAFYGPLWDAMVARLGGGAEAATEASPFAPWLARAQARLAALDAAGHQRAGTGWLQRLGPLAGAAFCTLSWPGQPREVLSRMAPQGTRAVKRRDPRSFWAVDHELPGWAFVTAEVVDGLPPERLQRRAGLPPGVARWSL